jgi:hypothetical protein
MEKEMTASQARRQHPALVEAFEAAPLQQPIQLQQQPEQRAVAVEVEHVQVLEEQASEADDRVVLMSQQLEAAERLIREQSAQLKALQQPAIPTPAVVREGALERETSSVFGKPRTSDLREYEGASGSKLDEWLDEWTQVTALYELNERMSIRFALSRLRGAALQWWRAIGTAKQQELSTHNTLAAALRTRFQPITSEEVARTQLDALRQGTRHVNDYIADFQRIVAQIGVDFGEKDAKHAFVRGIRPDIATQLRMARVTSLQDAIALAAHVGSTPTVSQSTYASAAHGASRGGAVSGIHQMQTDEDDVDVPLDTRIERAVLNALQAQQTQPSSSTGTATGPQAQQQQKKFHPRYGRGGRMNGSARPMPTVHGVSEDEVRRRLQAKECLRCGVAGHFAASCPSTHIVSKN